MILSFFWKCHNTCISIFFKVNDAGQLEMHQAAKPAEGAKTDGPFPQTLVIIFVHSQLKYYLKGQEEKKKKKETCIYPNAGYPNPNTTDQKTAFYPVLQWSKNKS